MAAPSPNITVPAVEDLKARYDELAEQIGHPDTEPEAMILAAVTRLVKAQFAVEQAKKAFTVASADERTAKDALAAILQALGVQRIIL